MQRGGFIFLHLPFRDSFEERRKEAEVIPDISYIRIYEQESNRTRARDNRNGEKERTGTRRHKSEDVRICDFVCDLLLLRSGEQTDAGEQVGKINKQKNWEEKVNELVSFVRSKSTTPRIDKRGEKGGTQRPAGPVRTNESHTGCNEKTGGERKKNISSMLGAKRGEKNRYT